MTPLAMVSSMCCTKAYSHVMAKILLYSTGNSVSPGCFGGKFSVLRCMLHIVFKALKKKTSQKVSEKIISIHRKVR